VRCLGRILRCESTPGAKSGMAAAIEKYEFLPGNDATPLENDSPAKSKN
jgi:hypothetical protein